MPQSLTDFFTNGPDLEPLHTDTAAGQLVAQYGRPEWSDTRRSLESRASDFVRFQAQRGLDNSAFTEAARQYLPDANPDALVRPFEQERGLAQARQRFSQQRPNFLEDYLLHGAPVVSFVGQLGMAQQYTDAQRRYRAGNATPDDFAAIARQERLQELEQGGGTALQVARIFQTAPGIAVEATLTGGVGRAAASAVVGARAVQAGSAGARAGLFAGQAGGMALAPSMWAPEVVQNLERNGGNWYDARNLGPAAAVSAINSLVLGSVARYGGTGVSGFVSRVALGMGEQQAADTVTAMAGLRTRGGVLESLWNGEGGEAARHAGLQALTFAVLGAMHHEWNPRENPVVRATAQADPAAIGEGMRTIYEALLANPDLSRAEGRRAAQRIPRGRPARRVAEAAAEALPTAEQIRRTIEFHREGPLDMERVTPEGPGGPTAADRNLQRGEIEGEFGTPTPADQQAAGASYGSLPAELRARFEAPPNAEAVPELRQAADAQLRAPTVRADSPRTNFDPARQPGETARGHADRLDAQSVVLRQAVMDAERAAKAAADRAKLMGAPTSAKVAAKGAAKRLRDARKALDDFLPVLDQARGAAALETPPAAPPPSAPPKVTQTSPEPVLEPPAQSSQAAGGQTVVKAPAPAGEGEAAAEPTWHPTGTEFRDRPDGSLEFTGRNNETYTLRADEHAAPENVREHDDQRRVQVRAYDVEGREVGRVDFYSEPDGGWRPEGLHVETRHREGKERRTGVSSALYDFMAQANGQTVKPAKGQTDAGKSFWKRNQDFKAEQLARAGQKPPEPAPQPPAAPPEPTPEPSPAGPPPSPPEPTRGEAAHAELEQLMIESGLSDREAHVVREGMARSLADIGRELGISKQRVKQIEKAALAKLGAKPGDSLETIVKAAERAGRAAVLIEDGRRPARTDAGTDAAVVARYDTVGMADARLEQLQEAMGKELQRGELPPERMKLYESAINEQNRILAGRGTGETPATAELLGLRPGGAPGPAPVQRGAGAAVPQGGATPAVVDPGAGGPAVRPDAAGQTPAPVRGPGAAAGGDAGAPAAAGGRPAPGHKLTAEEAREANRRKLEARQAEKALAEHLGAEQIAAMKEAGVDPAHVLQAAAEIKAQDAADLALIEDFRRELFRKFPALRTIPARVGKGKIDSASIKKLDEIAHGGDFDPRFEALFAGHENARDERLFEILSRARAEPMSDAEAHALALDRLAAMREQEAYREFESQARAEGVPQSEIERVAAETAAGATGPPEAGGAETAGAEAAASAEAEAPADIGDFDFGHNAGGDGGNGGVAPRAPADEMHSPRTSAPGMGAASGGVPRSPAPFGAPGASGPAPAPPPPAAPPTSWFRKALDFLKSFGNQAFPALTRLDRQSGEKLAEAANAAPAAKAAWEYFSRVLKVGGKELRALTPEEDALVGAVWLERRARHLRDWLYSQGRGKEAGEVVTFVGQQGSPIATEAEYQQHLRALWPFFEAVRQEWTPEVDKNYRGLMNIDPLDAIESPSQIPTLPLNAIALGEDAIGRPGVVATGRRQGLDNLRVRRPGYTQAAGLAAPAYELSVGKMMQRTLNLGVPASRRAEFVRRGIEGGVLRVVSGRGEKVDPAEWSYLALDPAHGLPGLAPGANYYAKPEVYQEVLQGLGIGTRFGQRVAEGLRPVMDKLYNFALLSPVELATHTANHVTALFRSGMGLPIWNLKDSIGNARALLRGDPEMYRRVKELADLGAAFHHEARPGVLGERLKQYDPTYWVNRFTSKFIDTMQHAVRVQLGDAFDRMARGGYFENTPTAKRDFVNQALGNYSGQANNFVTQFLKDSGLQGFATAAHTFTTQGIKAATGGAINARATSTARALELRGYAALKALPFLTAGPVLNLLLWGKAFPKDVPAFAVQTRKDDDKVHFFDPVAFTGMRRGARALGLNALVEAAAQGDQTAGEVLDRAVRDAKLSLTHLFEGPPAQFLHTLDTGENALGHRVAARVSSAHTPAGQDRARRQGLPPPGSSQSVENLKAALAGVNPLVATFAGGDRPRSPRSLWENLMQSAGPFGERTRSVRRPGRSH